MNILLGNVMVRIIRVLCLTRGFCLLWRIFYGRLITYDLSLSIKISHTLSMKVDESQLCNHTYQSNSRFWLPRLYQQATFSSN